MQTQEKQSLYVESRAQWRNWLAQNHHSKTSIWLICNTKKSGLPTVSWSELVDEALCFGWIDSTRKSINQNQFTQLFTRRKAKGTWSKINKEKIERLIENGLMTQVGLNVIEAAKQNGSWVLLDDVEE